MKPGVGELVRLKHRPKEEVPVVAVEDNHVFVDNGFRIGQLVITIGYQLNQIVKETR